MENHNIKTIDKLKYYTGSHPKIRPYLRTKSRPQEHGDKIWATSLVLVPFLKKCSIKLNQLRVLEIGCGWGLLGVHLAKMYCCKVTCSDYDAKVLPIVKEQAELNKVSIETKKLSFNELSSEYLDNFDLIIGSEVCYSDETSLAITQMIQRASLGNPKNILIADPGRPGFHDCYKVCSEYFSTKLTVLPGSINGKVTYLLTVAT